MLYEENFILKTLNDIDIRVGCISLMNIELPHTLGFELIYQMLNERTDCFCERIIYPDICSRETNTSLSDFDIISFTFHHTTDYFNMIEMLKKSDVPIFRKDRTADDPIVICGGSSITANPMPIKDFFDICCIGEAEVILNELLDTYKKLNNPRKQLEEFLKVKGLYICELDNNTEIAMMTKQEDRYYFTNPVVFKDENNKIVKPIWLDVVRGCDHGCRYCMVGYLYRPTRITPYEKLIEIAEKTRENTGLNKVILVGPDLSYHPQLYDLINYLEKRGFNIQVPSIRPEKLTKDYFRFLKNSGLPRFDLAPETCGKIRKSMNKDISDEVIENAIRMVFEEGMDLKLLMMIGFPNESDEDVVAFAKYIKSIINLRNSIDETKRIQIKLSPTVPKPYTPLQWAAYDTKTIQHKFEVLFDELVDLNLTFIGETPLGQTYENNSINIQINCNSNEECLKEYILSCAGTKLSEFLINESYDSPISEWMKYYPKFEIGDELPWDKINLGYKKSFLLREYRKMFKIETTPWCKEKSCYNCKDNCYENPFINHKNITK